MNEKFTQEMMALKPYDGFNANGTAQFFDGQGNELPSSDEYLAEYATTTRKVWGQVEISIAKKQGPMCVNSSTRPWRWDCLTPGSESLSVNGNINHPHKNFGGPPRSGTRQSGNKDTFAKIYSAVRGV